MAKFYDDFLFFLKLFSRSTFMFAYRSVGSKGGGQEPIHEGGQR